jgi:hypothetical protein
MKTTTLLEVMVEVQKRADEMQRTPFRSEGSTALVGCAIMDGGAALRRCGDTRRDSLTLMAAWAILALHAHDVEAAQSSDGHTNCPGSRNTI